MLRGPSRFLLVVAATTFLGALTADRAWAAFTYSTFGAKAGFIVPEERNESFALGVHVQLGKPRTNFLMLPGIMYWSSGGLSDLNANFDAYYSLSVGTSVVPFIGAGIGLHLLRFENTNLNLGTNLFGGIRIPAPGMDWFVEGRYTSTEVSQLGVLVGLTLRP
ncbi:MAG TPA: hypothetical protein VFP10_13665 [Candidatus Eisenbacteria bacterium]|nr:hypothetical protein [Candidatus Eisenbacteria bacterium]